MDHPARKIAFLWLLLLTVSSLRAQQWVPKFQLGLSAEAAATAENVSLSRYLSQNADYNAGDHGCFLKISLFHFRVTGRGEIDSVYAQGTLNQDLVATIESNILATKGKWKVPSNTTTSDKCWFIFPFVDPGKSRSCSEHQRASRHAMIELLRLYVSGLPIHDKLGRVILPPNDFPQFDEK